MSLLAAASVAACAGTRGSVSARPRVTPDSVVGVIAVTGTSFEQQVMLRADDRWVRLRVGSADSAALTRLGGVEAVVRGVADATGFGVRSFTVLRVDGAHVFDGVLRRDAGRLVLETTTGARLELGNPPPAFPALVGARLWIGGALATGPNVYGVIVPPP